MRLRPSTRQLKTLWLVTMVLAMLALLSADSRRRTSEFGATVAAVEVLFRQAEKNRIVERIPPDPSLGTKLLAMAKPLHGDEQLLPLSTLALISNRHASSPAWQPIIQDAIQTLGQRPDPSATTLIETFKILSQSTDLATLHRQVRQLKDLDEKTDANRHESIQILLPMLMSHLANLDNRYSEAMAYMTEALAHIKQAHAPAYRLQHISALMSLANLMISNKIYDSIPKYLIAAQQLMTPDLKPYFQTRLKILQALTLGYLHQPQLAATAYLEALDTARLYGDYDHIAIWALANLSDTYLQKGDYQQALQVLENAKKSHHNPNAVRIELLEINAGEAKIMLNRVDEGLVDIERGLKRLVAKNELANMASISLDIAEYLEKANQWQTALHYYRNHLHWHDQTQHDATQTQIVTSQLNLERDQRQFELSELNRELQLQRELARKTEWINLALRVLVFMIVASIIISYWLLRSLRQRRSALLEIHQALNHQAEHDQLTACANRYKLQARVAQLPTPQGWRGTVLALDLDHFKCINDTYGHAAGDRVLVEATRRWQSILSADHVLARMGGEEFVVLAPGLNEPESLALAERLRRCLAEQAIEFEDYSIQVTVSVGGIDLPRAHHDAIIASMTTWSQVFEQVDAMLYLAKSTGRNRIEFLCSPPELPPNNRRASQRAERSMQLMDKSMRWV